MKQKLFDYLLAGDCEGKKDLFRKVPKDNGEFEMVPLKRFITFKDVPKKEVCPHT